MINVSQKDNPEFYFDYGLGLNLLRSVKDEDYSYPEEKVNFHIYTEVRSDKEVECVKSFLATQNLDHTSLIIWSDYSIEDNELIQPYKDYLDLRVYNAREEAVGTPMEHEHSMLDASDSKYYLKSDLFRLMMLHKYGGVWADMDIIFLRDFKPILDQEYMYQWGGDTDFANLGACATVLAMKKENFAREEVLLPKEEKKKRKEEIEKLELEAMQMQKLRFGVNGDYFQKRQELIKPIQDDVYEAMQNVASKRNYAFVFDKANQSNLVYADSKYDISNSVLKDMGFSAK